MFAAHNAPEFSEFHFRAHRAIHPRQRPTPSGARTLARPRNAPGLPPGGRATRTGRGWRASGAPAFLAALALLALSLAGAAASGFADEAPGADSTTAVTSSPGYGLAVGVRAPSFRLRDQDGEFVTLDSLVKAGPVALVFFRSADWCLYCKLQLAQLEDHLEEIESSGGRIVGISYDSVAALKRFYDRRHLHFPLLSDPGSKVIDAYGVRGDGVHGEAVGVARHAIFVVDSDMMIRSKSYQVSHAERRAVEALAAALTDARTASPGDQP